MPSESVSRSPRASTTITRPRSLPAAASTRRRRSRARRAEQVGDGGGDHVGLLARLRAHLGVDPVGHARSQRHLERDDGQHEHVGQRQQQPGAEAYGTAPSAALNRKPTPRTVWM